ncbi:translation elongation factor Ts [Patescibacteria group bacterium]|nr:translation elongation factor Ts [Patescibacteria group bacterium]
MKLDVKNIKKLREETGAGVLEVKKTLEETNGDYKRARQILMEKVGDKAAKKADRETKDGIVVSYIHSGGRIGSLVVVACETDFVAKTDDFKKLADEIAMQVCTDDYESVDDLLKDDYIRDSSKNVQDLINETIAKVGEKIEIKDFVKFSVLN